MKCSCVEKRVIPGHHIYPTFAHLLYPNIQLHNYTIYPHCLALTTHTEHGQPNLPQHSPRDAPRDLQLRSHLRAQRVANAQGCTASYNPSEPEPISTSLFLVNKQVYAESQEIFLKRNTFRFNDRNSSIYFCGHNQPSIFLAPRLDITTNIYGYDSYTYQLRELKEFLDNHVGTRLYISTSEIMPASDYPPEKILILGLCCEFKIRQF